MRDNFGRKNVTKFGWPLHETCVHANLGAPPPGLRAGVPGYIILFLLGALVIPGGGSAPGTGARGVAPGAGGTPPRENFRLNALFLT